MSADVLYQIIGYIGSALVVTSLTMKSLLKLRLIGLAGASVFSLYGLLIQAYPVAGVNIVIIFVHLVFLRELLSKKTEYFTILHVLSGSLYLQYFLDYHEEDIHKAIPEFVYEPADDQVSVFILRNLVPAGLFIGCFRDDGSLQVMLDFVIPEYRDFKIGEFLYSTRSGIFADERFQRAWSRGGTREYTDYLKRMGFVRRRRDGKRRMYAMDLSPLNETADA